MTYARLFFLLFAWLAPAFATSTDYLKDLEELGYCVIPQLISAEETEVLYERVWHEFIEKAWPNCKMDDRSNWKEAFPMHNIFGIFAGPAGQTQVMWDVRQDPRIVDVFAHLWNTSDLIVSMDGMSLMCPSEIREGYFEPWPHVDQFLSTAGANFASESSLKTGPFTVQGQFLFQDSFEGDAGFYCIPKSHLRFPEFALQLEAIHDSKASREERKKTKKEYLLSLFEHGAEGKHITAPRGSLILWDSRTLHWNQHAKESSNKVRMVGYLCYVPKTRLTSEGLALRKEAFETGTSTSHNPAFPTLKTTKNETQQEFERYAEDPSYAQPKINLTPLGESLLGL